MKKLAKRKTGFTLIEVVLVIAIICILVPVLLIGYIEQLDRARNTASSVSAHNAALDEATSAIGG